MVYGQTVSVIVSIKSTFSTLGQSDVCHFRSILGPVGSLQINKRQRLHKVKLEKYAQRSDSVCDCVNQKNIYYFMSVRRLSFWVNFKSCR